LNFGKIIKTLQESDTVGHPLDEFVLSDISGLPRLRRDFGLFGPPRQQGRPRTAALAE
jgi:hypothetical protein